MKRRSFWFVILVTIIGLSLSGCAYPILAPRSETASPPPPMAKVVPPETKTEIPVPPPREIKKEVLPPSVPAPAPAKKKKG
ncbi:MAG TPA: hypothetical protein VGJ94_15955 [Syntrophorhabdaceae bacterium]|jgi:hypothetical protein